MIAVKVETWNDLPGISDHTSIASIDILFHPCRFKQISCTIHLLGRANLPSIKESLDEKVKSGKTWKETQLKTNGQASKPSSNPR